MRSYARTWAAKFKDRGIRVNLLSPGVTDTPILDSQSAPREDLVKMYQTMIPVGLLARPEEMANAALYLASDQSSYMTGADLMNDGAVGQVRALRVSAFGERALNSHPRARLDLRRDVLPARISGWIT